MAIQLSPETERLVEQEIASGRFHSVDEIIHVGIHAKEDDDPGRSRRRSKALEHLRRYIDSPIPLNGTTIKELIEEGRKH